MLWATVINVLLFIAICAMIILIFKKSPPAEPMTNVVKLPKSPYHDPRTTFKKKAISEKLTVQNTGPINLLTYTRARVAAPATTENVVDMKLDKFDNVSCKDCA